MNTKLIILLLFLTFSGCDFLFETRESENLGSGYRFLIWDGSAGIVNSDSVYVISSEVLKYAYDSTFIIASQRPWDSIPGVPDLELMKYKERNEAFKQSTFKQYWIINKKEKNNYTGYNSNRNRANYSNVYGPYSKKEYLQKRVEMGVPEKLKLDFEEED